jgi:hypothetical protein
MWPWWDKDVDRKESIRDDDMMILGRRRLRVTKIKLLCMKAKLPRLSGQQRDDEVKTFQFDISIACTRRRRLLFLAESARRIMWPEYAFTICGSTNISFACSYPYRIRLRLSDIQITFRFFSWPFSVSGWQNCVRFGPIPDVSEVVYFFKTKPPNNALWWHS